MSYLIVTGIYSARYDIAVIFSSTKEEVVTEHDEFILKLKQDLNISHPIIVFINNKYSWPPSFEPVTTEEKINNRICEKIQYFKLTMRTSFYKRLTPNERLAVIAHEVNHTSDFLKFSCFNDMPENISESEMTKIQIAADNTAAKYTDPQTVKNALEKWSGKFPFSSPKSREEIERIENLDRLIEKSRTD